MNYYNEIDNYAADWIENLIAASDDAQVFDPNFDIGSGCEVFSDEDIEP